MICNLERSSHILEIVIGVDQATYTFNWGPFESNWSAWSADGIIYPIAGS